MDTDNVALSVFAGRILYCCVSCSNRSISPVSWTTAGKFSAVVHTRIDRQRDGWIGRTPNRCTDPEFHKMMLISHSLKHVHYTPTIVG